MAWCDATGFALAATRTDLGGWRWMNMPAGWVLTLAAIAIFFFLRALYQAERGRANMPVRLALAAVRTAVLVLLLLVLAGPFREEVRTAEERAHLVILVDTSGSMGASDRYSAEEIERLREAGWPEGAVIADEDVLDSSRLALVQRILGTEGEARLRDLDKRFVLHVFGFDVDWRGLGTTREVTDDDEDAKRNETIAVIGQSIRDLEAVGGGTDLGSVLRNVAGEFLGREDRWLAGVLLVTDGRHTSSGEGAIDALTGLGTPRRDLHVTAVALGNPSSGRNLRVERVRAMDVVLVEDDVVFESALRHVGFTGVGRVRAATTIVKVADADRKRLEEPEPYEPPEGAVLEAFPLTLGRETEPTPVRFRARMTEPGTFKVSIRASLPSPEAEMDAVAEDDVAHHWIRVVDQRIKVLLIDNYSRWDGQFLGNWLTREPPPDPTRPERRSRYAAQVFMQTANQAVEQSHSPDTPALRSIPRTRREIFEYDVIVLGDIEWMELAGSPQESRAVLELIRDFVDEGGGVALQAGTKFNNPLIFAETPLKDLLPVTPRARDKHASRELKNDDPPFRIRLTDAGRRHPIFGIVPGKDGGIASEEEVARIWEGAASYARYSKAWEWWWMYRATGGLRPGAIDLARVLPDRSVRREFLDDTMRPAVVFAVMPFGKGRVFFSALDTLWRLRRSQSDRFYGPFWDQVIRYLATYRLLGGNRRFKISTDKESYFAGEVATITITALDRDYEPMADAYLDGVHVEGPDGDDILLEGEDRPINLTPEGAAPGTYRLYWPLRDKGTYRVWIRDTEIMGRSGGAGSRAERRIEVEFRAPELRQTIPDHDLLRRIVEETDGRLVDGRLARLYDLDTLGRELPARTVERVLDRKERDQWDTPWVLLLLVGLLGVEWALRKRWQMI